MALIEVLIDQTGDRAEADTPEAALLAARTLLDDAWDANPAQGNRPTVTIVVDGKTQFVGLTRSEVFSA